MKVTGLVADFDAATAAFFLAAASADFANLPATALLATDLAATARACAPAAFAAAFFDTDLAAGFAVFAGADLLTLERFTETVALERDFDAAGFFLLEVFFLLAAMLGDSVQAPSANRGVSVRRNDAMHSLGYLCEHN